MSDKEIVEAIDRLGTSLKAKEKDLPWILPKVSTLDVGVASLTVSIASLLTSFTSLAVSATSLRNSFLGFHKEANNDKWNAHLAKYKDNTSGQSQGGRRPWRRGRGGGGRPNPAAGSIGQTNQGGRISSSLKSAGKLASRFVFNPLGDLIGAIGKGMKGLLAGLYKAGKSLVVGAGKIGWQIIAGVGKGLRSGVSLVFRAVTAFGRATIDLFRKIFRISSPSQVMIALGRDIGDGLAKGIGQGRARVAAATRQLVAPVGQEARKAAGSMAPLNKELAATSKEATRSGRRLGTATKGLKGIGPAGKIAGKGLKGVGAGFKSALGPAGLILMLLEPFLTKLIETVTNSKKFKKAVEVAMKGVSIAVGWVSKTVKKIFGWVKKNWKKLLPLLLGPFGAVITGVLVFRKQLTAGIKWVINWIKKNWKLLLAILTGPFGLAVAFVIKFRKRIGGAIGAAIGWIKGNWQRLLGILVRPFTAGASAVARVFSRIVSFARGLPGRIRGAIGSVGSVLAGKGRDLISGFINGIRSRAGAIISTIKGFVTDKIPGFVKNALGIRSPSTVMMGLGRNVSEGMAQGIQDGGRNVTDAMDALVAVPRTGAARAGALPFPVGRRGEALERRYEFHFHGPVKDPEETSRQFASRLREWEVLNAAS